MIAPTFPTHAHNHMNLHRYNHVHTLSRPRTLLTNGDRDNQPSTRPPTHACTHPRKLLRPNGDCDNPPNTHVHKLCTSLSCTHLIHSHTPAYPPAPTPAAWHTRARPVLRSRSRARGRVQVRLPLRVTLGGGGRRVLLLREGLAARPRRSARERRARLHATLCPRLSSFHSIPRTTEPHMRHPYPTCRACPPPR